MDSQQHELPEQQQGEDLFISDGTDFAGQQVRNPIWEALSAQGELFRV